MPRLEELVAFRAAVSLLVQRGNWQLLADVYERSVKQRRLPTEQIVNYVKEIYAPFADSEISDEITELLKPERLGVGVKIIFQSLDDLHIACPAHPGDWYFSGDYPTAGGTRLVNEAYISYYESCTAKN
jgi:amidophosphoribosyltransferase